MTEKKYSIIGKVEIGTDEYRDLIEAVKESQKNYENINSRYYAEMSRANKAEEQFKALKDQTDKMTGFINSSEELKAKYRLFIVEQQIKGDSQVE